MVNVMKRNQFCKCCYIILCTWSNLSFILDKSRTLNILKRREYKISMVSCANKYITYLFPSFFCFLLQALCEYVNSVVRVSVCLSLYLMCLDNDVPCKNKNNKNIPFQVSKLPIFSPVYSQLLISTFDRSTIIFLTDVNHDICKKYTCFR